MYYKHFYDYNKYDKNKKQNTMEVYGSGVVKVKPDIAIVTLGVITENENLQIAQKENSIITNNVIDSLKKMGIEEKDIQTKSYSIQKVYDYIEGKRVFRGYKVSNYLSVTIREIEQTGLIIDTAVENGANNVGNIEFKLQNPKSYYRKALDIAIKDVIIKAQGIGKTLRVKVNTIPREIIEERYNYRPIFRAPYEKDGETVTPIKLGQIEISASIKAIFSY